MTTQLRPGDRLLVLGGSGFIASHVLRALVGTGIDVVSYDLFDMVHPVPEGVAVTTVRGDVRDLPTLTRAMAGCSAVLNLAAAHHDFGISSATFESVNVGGARNVCVAMETHGISNLCFYSSVAVYGPQPVAPDETTTPMPDNDYGRTKLAAEGVYLAWQRADPARRALVVRPAVVFGPRNFANVHRMISQIDRRRFLPVGAGTNRKSMVFVTNVVQAILFLWMRSPVGGAPEVYNYVDKPDLTSRQIVSAVYRGLGRREPALRVPLRPALWAAKPFDLLVRVTGRNLPITSERIEKLAGLETSFQARRVREAGFSQPVTLLEGLAEMVRWYRAEGRDAEPVVHLPPEQPVIGP